MTPVSICGAPNAGSRADGIAHVLPCKEIAGIAPLVHGNVLAALQQSRACER
jgi:hypothetical protein